MIPRRRRDLVLALHLQSRGFAFILFEAWLAPVDWGVQEVRGPDKNGRCLERIDALFALHTPDVLVLQEMLHDHTHRALRIRRLNRKVIKIAERRGIAIHMYSRDRVRESFVGEYGAATKQRIAEAIANQLPALDLYVPPSRKPWMSEHARMGGFEAAALAWMYFHPGAW